MSPFLTRSGWLAPLATAALFAAAVAGPSACAHAVEGGALSGGDDDGESEKEFDPGAEDDDGTGGVNGYQGETSSPGAGGAPSTGSGNGGDPSTSASSVASSSSIAAASSSSSNAAASSVAASSSSSGGGPMPCCTEDIFPGCFDDFFIEACVCSIDDYCCSFEWDAQCVDEVESFGCGSCS